MKKFLIVIFTLFLLLSCSSEPTVVPRPQIKAIANVEDYQYMGVACKNVVSRGKSNSRTDVMVGIKDQLIEDIEFVGEKGNIIDEDFCVHRFLDIGDFIFFELSKITEYNANSSIYCLYKPSRKLFDITDRISIDWDPRCIDMYSTNDGKYTCLATIKDNDEVKSGICEIYVDDGDLVARRLIDTRLIDDFNYFYKDRYGNLYSLEHDGSVLTIEGKLKKIPLSNSPYVYSQYGLGANGISYYDNGTQKGYFDQKGNLVINEAGDFFPKIDFGEYQNDAIRSNIFYEEGDKLYYLYSDGCAGGIYFRPQGITKYTYDGPEKMSYEVDFIPFVDTPVDIVSPNQCKKYQQHGSKLTLICKSAIYELDLKTGKFSTISDSYHEYYDYEKISSNLGRFTAMNENMEMVSGFISDEGEIITDVIDVGFDSIKVVPIK